MEFKVIKFQQTPKVETEILVDDLKNVNFILHQELTSFLNYAFTLDAAGIAANQLQIKRDNGNKERFNYRAFCMKLKDRWIICINPKITKKYGYSLRQHEGCLTWPGKTIIANRYTHIDVEYYDLDGTLQKRKYKKWYAQVFQHELNHLDGVEEIFK